MLIIRKNEINNLIATVSMNKTLPNPYYLFSFQNITTKERISFIPQVIISNTRYDKFRFVEGTTNLSLTPPHAFFKDLGQYYYSIYEQVSSGNTNPSLTYNKLESGRAVVIVGNSQTDECLFEPYISPNEDAYSIVYLSEQEEFCITTGTLPYTAYSQILPQSSGATINSTSCQYFCSGSSFDVLYSYSATSSVQDVVDLFNTTPPIFPNTDDFTQYGTYYDNEDGRIRLEIPYSTYMTLCSGGTITLNVFAD